MAGWLSFVLIAATLMIATAQSRVIPTKPISVMLDTYGNPIMFLRDKRTAMRPYPQRAMMFTGYYRPVRRSNNGGQATGVFAQGNAVSGEAFFGDVHTPHLKGGPEPIEEPEVSSAEAQAAPTSGETYDDEEQEHHTRHQEGQRHEHRYHEEEEQQHHIDAHHRQDSEHQGPEQVPSTTEIAQPAEQPIASSTEVSTTRPKVHRTKKVQKKPVIVDDDNDDDDNDEEDEVDEEDDEPVVPFVPFKSNRRRQGYPNLNNFFPMIFSFPRAAARAGSAGSPPGAITAIANSYSTGKGGVASSVATAYGGSPTGKKRRAQPSEE